MNTGPTGAKLRASAVMAALMIGTAAASAGDLEYRAIAGFGYTDNARRIPTNETDETIGSMGLRFSYNENSKVVNADVVGDLAYNKYFDDTFASKLKGNVYADGAVALVQERILWTATDQFGQVLDDPFLPATEENSENINYFSTGPDFYIGMGSQMRLRLGGRYSLTDYERSPLDMQSTGAQISLLRSLSDRRTFSINARAEQVEYDNTALDADFDLQEAYARYEAFGARTNVSFDAGFTQLDREVQGKESGALFRVNMSRRISGSSTVSLRGGRQFSTSAGAFISEQGIGNTGLSTTPGRQTAEPFTYDNAGVGWHYTRNRTFLTFDASWSHRMYEEHPTFDHQLQSWSVRYHRDLSPVTSIEFTSSLSSSDYQAPSPDFKDFGAGMSFSWRLSRAATFGAKYEFTRRSADTAATEFEENLIWLTLSFGLGEPRITRLEPSFGVDAQAPQGN